MPLSTVPDSLECPTGAHPQQLATAPRHPTSAGAPRDPITSGRSFWRHPWRIVRARLRMIRGQALSTRWGLDRGLPAHRYYLQMFLREFHADIRGTCLEFEDREYLASFGGDAVERADVLHLDHNNPRATVVADITQPSDLPDDTYDCIICTHVLMVIADLPAALETLHRILKPGGVLLCSEPQTSMVDEREGELWRFTRLGLERLLARWFGRPNVTARSYGNSLVAAGEMRGLIADEFTTAELLAHDPRFGVEVCARAVKS